MASHRDHLRVDTLPAAGYVTNMIDASRMIARVFLYCQHPVVLHSTLLVKPRDIPLLWMTRHEAYSERI